MSRRSGILDVLHSAGIQAIVVKGAALMHLIYPEPGLRPIRDLDILVPRQHAGEAQQRLIDQLDLPPGANIVGSCLTTILATIARKQEFHR